MIRQPIEPSPPPSLSPRTHWMTSVAWRALDAELHRLGAAIRGGAGHADAGARQSERSSVIHLPEPGALTRLARFRAIAEDAIVDDEPGVAVIGRRVTIRDTDGVQSTYALVLPGDGDPTQGWVSSDSPLGAALTRARAGDVVDVAAPAGSWRATVVAVK